MSRTSKIILYSLLSLVLLAGISFGIYYYIKSNKIVSILTMDINPSIKVSLNYKNKVVKAEGLNEDGKQLLGTNKFKGDSLKTVIGDITKIVIEKGYITKEDNSILINVEGKDIKTEVVTLMESEFKNRNTECNIVIQEINEGAKEAAAKYGISESKASYIESIIKENGDITFEDLKDKSINEIDQTIKEKEVQKQKEQEQETQEQKEQEHETQKQEEPKKEEPKMPVYSGSDSIQERICNAAVHNYTKEAAVEAARKYIGADSTILAEQSTEYYYGEVCAYETYMIYNKTLYKMYHSVTDLSLVHVESTKMVANDYMDKIRICTDYFVNKYGALSEEVNVTGASNGLFMDGTYKVSTVSVTYKGNNYDIKLNVETGDILSETKSN